MHWFWRATIAVVACSVIYAVMMTVIADRPVLYQEIRFLFNSELIAVWIFMAFPIGATAILVYGIITYRWGPRLLDNETRCRRCGYILKGISEPRCPECGEKI